ncbi:MAG: LacI family DNA-binding transcriptional regulator [Anaerolineaceae bacterium]|nr:LacI family DNA-binding transcriptional regulator [Anaerolineaceae bacterium]
MTPVTIRDVAREAGVSPGTVSRAMNDSPLVNAATRQRVLEVVQTLNYSPNLTARKLSLGKTLTISVVLPFLTRPSYIERLNGVIAALTPSQYDMVIHSVQTPEQRNSIFEDVIRRERSDGVLIISLPPMDSEVNFLSNADIPIVLIDAIHPELNMLDQVFIDDVEGGKMATRHLIDLGHKKIGYIGDIYDTPFRFSSSRDRYHGYRLALEEAGLPFVEKYYAEDEHGRLEAKHLAHHMLSQDDAPTAIFAYSDTTAWGIMEAAQGLGIRIPDHLSLIGFDNIEIAEYLKITTIYQPLFDSGQRGMQLLLEKLENPKKNAVQEQQSVYLINRQTTSSPK